MKLACPENKSADRDLESLVLTKVLQTVTGVKVTRPQKHLFQTVSQQKEYLRCYRGIQEGAVYPLESGECCYVYVRVTL